MGSKPLERRHSATRSCSRAVRTPREQSRDVCTVVHVVILEVACHAGGRGFESRRSRLSKCLQIGTISCQLDAEILSVAQSWPVV
jgi:hypothetical protein